MVKEWEFLEEAEISLLASRRIVAARGYLGGGAGALGKDLFSQDGIWKKLPSSARIMANERCRIQTPGGGGWGKS